MTEDVAFKARGTKSKPYKCDDRENHFHQMYRTILQTVLCSSAVSFLQRDLVVSTTKSEALFEGNIRICFGEQDAQSFHDQP